jgi:cellulose synthase (UDP-forming)
MFLLPSFVLVTGILPVAGLDWGFAARFVPWYLLSLWACEELGRGYARSWVIEQYNFLRSPAFMFATLTFFLNRRLRFRVTSKSNSTTRDNARRMAPQLALIAIAVICLIAGTLRFMLARHLPPGALLFNIGWCVVVLTTSISAVLFAFRHSKQERASYRFKQPVPIRIRDITGHEHLIYADDISSGGFSAMVPEGLARKPGENLDADLILPSGVMCVGLQVRRISDAPGPRILGASFERMTGSSADALDQYLYGSNAQWTFQRLAEKGNTPIESIRTRLRARRDVKLLRPAFDWRPGIAVPNDLDRLIEVLASTDDSSRRIYEVLSDSLLNVGTTLALILPDWRRDITYYEIASRAANERDGRISYRYRLTETGTSSRSADARQAQKKLPGTRVMETAA